MSALWLAGFFLALSALLIFGVPLAIRGRYAIEDMCSRPEPRIFAGFLITTGALLIMAPVADQPLISGGEQVLTVAQYILGLSWT